MKVVLFCGGMGSRLKDYSETIPKPMVPVSGRPILWNIMKYYSHFGHNDFILALGYKSEHIKNYFLNYDDEIANNIKITEGNHIEVDHSDIKKWKITFVDTGMTSNVGTRLFKLKKLLEEEEYFMANYADGLTDMNLDILIDDFKSDKGCVASFMSFRPESSLHEVVKSSNGLVKNISPFNYSNSLINAGYFIFTPEIFCYLENGEELVLQPFQRLIQENKLRTYTHKGNWRAMDTFKDKMIIDKMAKDGQDFWQVWKNETNDYDQI